MKYLQFIAAIAIGFLGPAIIFNLSVKYGLVPAGEETTPIPASFRNYYFGGSLWALAGTVPFAIASLFMDARHAMTSMMLWLPAVIPVLYCLGVLIVFFY